MEEQIINLSLEIDEEIELELIEEPAVHIQPSGRPITVVNLFDEELTDLINYYEISKL
jgi:hypothetical protein